MPIDTSPPPTAIRDGTSQAGRRLGALDPASAPIDERTVQELMAFARAYARELVYVDPRNPKRIAGDWSGLVPAGLDLRAVESYLENPAAVSAADAEHLSRPHVALFLAFLDLLGLARQRLNALTRRHLEFVYGDVLRMTRKPAVPDRVHVLFDVDPVSDHVAIPAGTTLLAGKDDRGVDLHYRTVHEVVASRAHVAALKSLHAEVRTTGLVEASRRYLTVGSRDEAFLGMLRIALGDPYPGDPLPVPIYSGVPAAKTSSAQPDPSVTFDTLMKVASLLQAVPESLGMPAFDDFRALMRLKATREQNDPTDWHVINGILASASARRDPNARFTPSNPMAFLTNVQSAIGVSEAEYAHLFDGLPEVKSLEAAYESFARRPDVAQFIESRLYLSVEQFRTLMQTYLRLEGQWGEIDRIIETAGQRKRADPAFALPASARSSRDVDVKLVAALGPPDYRGLTGLEAFHEAFLAVERYFFMSAEQVVFLLAMARGTVAPDPDDWDWRSVYGILTEAYREKVYASRRVTLSRLAAQPLKNKRPLEALIVQLAAALDVTPPDSSRWPRFLEECWPRLSGLGVSSSDLRELQAIAAGSAADWTRVAAVLEVAQRNREAVPPPVPQTVAWRNLYPADDATVVAPHGAAVAHEDGEARWLPFGPREQPRERTPVPAPVFGWGLTSPLLALAEGTRSIAVTLGCAPDPTHFDRDRLLTLFAPGPLQREATFNPWVLAVSTEDGWTIPSAVVLAWSNDAMMGYPTIPGADTTMLAALTFRITIAEDQPALVAPRESTHGITSEAPVVRWLLRPIWDAEAAAYVTAYDAVRHLMVGRVSLGVSVQGLRSLALRNDLATLDPKQAFEPFGLDPSVGARLLVGHAELVTKRLDTLTLRIGWKGVPVSLPGHYANYPAAPPNNSYTARVSLADRGLLRPFSSPMALFESSDASLPIVRTLTAPADQGRVEDVDTSPADVSDWPRHLVLELNADFQHAAYPAVSLQKSLEMAAAVANGTPKPLVPSAYQVNQPVVPTIKSFRIDYTASVELPLTAASQATGRTRLIQVEPFGYAAAPVSAESSSLALMPSFTDEGTLYIGLADVTPPQTVSLLFQVAEGSANPDREVQPIRWSVLDGDRWTTLHDGGLLADDTRGFVNSGIVTVVLKPISPSTRMPGALYWLRASIAQASDGVCDMVAVATNAALATFEGHGNSPDHLAHPLPAGAITDVAVALPGLAAVRQPYSSFGGRMAEVDASFHVRVSERLRHRERAVTPWDYERLVLEKFPRLYKVKCLRADPLEHPRSPGRVDVIVIPDIRNRIPFDPFEPKAPADLIRDIDAFLALRSAAGSTVRVRNARYVSVKVRCGVRFVQGRDEGYSRRQLNDDLNRFLAPWAYDEGADVVIGGRVYANSIIDFMEQREYVDYVAEFKLFTSDDGGHSYQFVPETSDYHASAGRPDAVLVSARQHQFDVIGHADYRMEVFHGINYMQVGLDFIVG